MVEYGCAFPRFTTEAGEPVDDFTHFLIQEAVLGRYAEQRAQVLAHARARAAAAREGDDLLEQYRREQGYG